MVHWTDFLAVVAVFVRLGHDVTVLLIEVFCVGHTRWLRFVGGKHRNRILIRTLAGECTALRSSHARFFRRLFRTAFRAHPRGSVHIIEATATTRTSAFVAEFRIGHGIFQ
jgi:hypothetical protein